MIELALIFFAMYPAAPAITAARAESPVISSPAPQAPLRRELSRSEKRQLRDAAYRIAACATGEIQGDASGLHLPQIRPGCN